jgi:hypothetical protein
MKLGVLGMTRASPGAEPDLDPASRSRERPPRGRP